MRIALISAIVIFLSGCFPDTDKNISESRQQSEYQSFTISCDRDTIIQDTNGIKIRIRANTFTCDKDNTVKIGFSTILSKYEMIINNIYTIDEKGRFLETGGMFRIVNLSNDEDKFREAITLEIPANYINDRMSKYLLEQSDEGISYWVNSNEILETKGTDGLFRGRELYNANCASCHSKNMREVLTGPALGNIHLFRGGDWLIEFTKNSQKMIVENDSIALCLWQAWGPTLMNSYEYLSDEEIKDIYEFIANESSVQNIGLEEIKYVTECDITPLDVVDTFNFDSLVIIQGEPFLQPLNAYRYLIDITSSSWVNADFLSSFEDEIDPIAVKLNEQYENISMVLVFENRDIAVPFVFEEDSNLYRLWHPLKKDKISFPLGERVKIITVVDHEKFKYNILDYQPKEKDNFISIELEEGEEEEFLELLKKL
ncbi:MAG: cytochrome c [Bacteroidota bacterium]